LQEGYIQVTLRELPHAPGSKTIPIEMAVIDTGKGIGKEFLKEQLFHPFSQENPLQTGTGLGLAIVNSIVRSDGVNGKVDVWSAEGMGTEIRVSFEATIIDEEDESSSSQSATSSQSSAFGGNHSVSIMGFDSSQRGHILSLDVLSTYACSWDFDIKDVADIAIVHEDEPFARNQLLQQKPVIYLSGSRRGEITDLANRTMKAGGFLQVLYKPIGPSALRDALSSAVNWLQSAPDLASPLSPDGRPSVSRSSSDNSAASADSAESNSTVSELACHKQRSVHHERLPLYRRRSEETEQKTVVPRPTMAPRGLTYHHAPPPSLTRKVSMAESESSQNSGSPSSSTLSTISLADGGVMLKAAAQPLKASTKGQGPRVLVVEDNVINRRVLGAFLKKRGFEWAEAYDGQEGVDVFNSTPANHWE
jgi:CheY-like chemotaxis protein